MSRHVSGLIDPCRIRDAAGRIEGLIIRTPSAVSPTLSDLLGVPVSLKLESLQRGGSFKSRGAAARLLTLTRIERGRGVVAVSGGNHAIAVAEMAAKLCVRAIVVMPRAAPELAVAAARSASAEVVLTDTIQEAFEAGEGLRRGGLVMIHPFDDPVVIAGQGTVGLEFAEDAGSLTDVLVSVGGGGLISGVATAMREARPDVRVWGVELHGADAMAQALAVGAPVAIDVTSSVSTLGAPSVSWLTYNHVKALVTGIKVVSDADALQGCIEFAQSAKLLAEPAAGCLLAAARMVIAEVGPHARLGLVVCGGNVPVGTLCRWARVASPGA